MKRFFILSLFAFVFSYTALFAKDYTFKRDNGDSVQVSTTTTTATITYNNTGSKTFIGYISVWSTKSPGGSLSGKIHEESLVFTPTSDKTRSFTVSSLTPNTTYYLNLDKIEFQTESLSISQNSVSADPLRFEPEGDHVNVFGKIDISKLSNPEALDVRLEYSQDGTFSTDLKVRPKGTLEAKATTSLTTNNTGVNSDGTYYWRLPNIDPVGYWYRETFYNKNEKVIGTPVVNKFNGGTGFSPTSTSEEQSDFEQRSYRLLAPLPGLTVLLDPDLCREKQIENPGQGQICDINSFLNYVFRLLIGVSAVILVIRIIIEGFKYATSDIPLVKGNSREKLWQGVWGLLLALSAWLILNTINPKLVENDINIPNVNLAYEEEPYQSSIPADSGTIPRGPVAKCTEGIERINTKGGMLNVCKKISANVKLMIDTAWAQGIKLSGGGFRTPAEQITLRRQNCGAENIYNKHAKCTPPTAYPGRSNHESGLAIDFMCEGTTIATQDNKCFVWLKQNANKYSLINFSKEPWHWSIDGR